MDILTGGGIAPLDAISYPPLHGIFVNEDNWSNPALVAEYIGSNALGGHHQLNNNGTGMLTGGGMGSEASQDNYPPFSGIF